MRFTTLGCQPNTKLHGTENTSLLLMKTENVRWIVKGSCILVDVCQQSVDSPKRVSMNASRLLERSMHHCLLRCVSFCGSRFVFYTCPAISLEFPKEMWCMMRRKTKSSQIQRRVANQNIWCCAWPAQLTKTKQNNVLAASRPVRKHPLYTVPVSNTGVNRAHFGPLFTIAIVLSKHVYLVLWQKCCGA